VSAHVDDCRLSCKSLTVMAEFKAHMLDRFIGTDEGEVTEYLGCELVRDRKAHTGQLIQAGHAERVLRVFNMWKCIRCPEVVDPLVHRKYRRIVGGLSYLVHMTRPGLAFSFSQLSKFLQYPGDAHLAAAYRLLVYVKGTLNQVLSYHERECCLLVLNLVSSTLSCIRQPILEWESATSCQVGWIAIFPLI
jgi:hypothetical protein